MIEPAPGRCPPAWRARTAGRCGESHGPCHCLVTPGVPCLSLLLQGTHSCHRSQLHQPLKLAALVCVPPQLGGLWKAQLLQEPSTSEKAHRRRGRAPAGPDLPTPTRHLHTCPEAPGWAMHTAGTHSRLAKPPLFKHHGTRSNPDKSSRPRAPPQDKQDWGGRGQGEGHRPERLSIWDLPNSGLFPENLIFSGFFFFGKKMTF